VKVEGGSKIEVHSAGFTDGNYALVKVNEKEMLTREEAKRGFNMVALDFETHKLIHKKSYDTYGDEAASAALLEDLKNLPNFSVIIVGIKDEGSRKLSKDVKGFFKEMGSKEVKHIAFREGWAFIGIKGLKGKMTEKRGMAVGTGQILGYGKITKKVVTKRVKKSTSSKTTKTTTTKSSSSETETKKVVKQVAEKVKGGSRLEVQSAGFKGGNYAIVNVAGKMHVSKETAKNGINVVALDATTHKLILNKDYDTSRDSGASAKFIEDFKNLPAASVILVAVKNEASKLLSTEAKEVFGSMGSVEVYNLGLAEGWAFIGVKGQKIFVEKRGDIVGTGAIMSYA